ncbi:MAG: hypothetical protein R3297_07570 [Desulfobulbales bacterium]|nr:hypothetical protein [Desulfobulbales bacterium]
MEPEKKRKLEDEGYDFDSDLQCFVNKKVGKIFSSAWIDNQNLNTLQITVSLPHNPATWKILSDPEQPHEEMREALFNKYGKTP